VLDALTSWLGAKSRSIDSSLAFAPIDTVAAILSLILFYQFLTFPAVGEENLPSFANLDPQIRKTEFLEYLQPIVQSVNDAIRSRRAHALSLLSALDNEDELPLLDRYWVQRMVERYRIDTSDEPPAIGDLIAKLVDRIDVVPDSLVLVQAAVESGWGTSRFATEGNNLFGQRCFESGCGLVPSKRATGSRFELATFDSVRGSVESYILNLNRHPLHEPLRALRSRLRDSGERPTGLSLARGLQSYSERGAEYVSEIQSLIIDNGLEMR